MPNEVTDFEDDTKRKLSITDPYGNEMDESKAQACVICQAGCSYADINCYGNVTMLDDMMHKCEFHKRHGAPNNWYVSEPSTKESPFPRELGKELSNNGGTYSDEPDSGSVDNGMIRKSDDDETTEDPHYTDGDIK